MIRRAPVAIGALLTAVFAACNSVEAPPPGSTIVPTAAPTAALTPAPTGTPVVIEVASDDERNRIAAAVTAADDLSVAPSRASAAVTLAISDEPIDGAARIVLAR